MNFSQIADPAPRADDGAAETFVQYVCEDGTVEIRRSSPAEPYEITLLPTRSDLYVPRKTCRTNFSRELIHALMERTDFAWLCDTIARHEDNSSVPGVLKHQLFSYATPEDFAGKRLLDFGCGNGASSMTIGRLLPQTEVIGVELGVDKVELADRIRAYRQLENVRFLSSPSGSELPPGIGQFDFVMLSAVYEHLLPAERKIVMPLLWSSMKAGALIFINQTPYPYFPLEAHSSGLWFINYLPDRLAHAVVRRLARGNETINKSPDWNVHLRGGLRGGTEGEILENLTGGNRKCAQIMQPRKNGVRDRADFWLSNTTPNRHRMVKQGIASAFRLTDALWGTIPSMNLEVVIRKVC